MSRVVLEHDVEHRHERQQQREDAEERPVRDRRGQPAAAVLAEALEHRERQRHPRWRRCRWSRRCEEAVHGVPGDPGGSSAVPSYRRYGDRDAGEATRRHVADRDELHAAAERRLARVGQRHTRQRRAILDLVATAGRPVSVPDLLGETPPPCRRARCTATSSCSRRVGVLQRVTGVGNHDRFELSEALSGQHHHHLTCTVCGLVIDIPADPAVEAAGRRRGPAHRRRVWRRSSPATASTSTAVVPTATGDVGRHASSQPRIRVTPADCHTNVTQIGGGSGRRRRLRGGGGVRGLLGPVGSSVSVGDRLLLALDPGGDPLGVVGDEGVDHDLRIDAVGLGDLGDRRAAARALTQLGRRRCRWPRR